jgi:hypothetical protein
MVYNHILSILDHSYSLIFPDSDEDEVFLGDEALRDCLAHAHQGFSQLFPGISDLQVVLVVLVPLHGSFNEIIVRLLPVFKLSSCLSVSFGQISVDGSELFVLLADPQILLVEAFLEPRPRSLGQRLLLGFQERRVSRLHFLALLQPQSICRLFVSDPSLLLFWCFYKPFSSH